MNTDVNTDVHVLSHRPNWSFVTAYINISFLTFDLMNVSYPISLNKVLCKSTSNDILADDVAPVS